jgi:tryptophan synthase alpha chain
VPDISLQGTPSAADNQPCAAFLAGLLVPDIPLEETPEIRGVASTHGLELVLLTTPTTPQERMQRIAQSSQGFVYLVSLTGARAKRPGCLQSAWRGQARPQRVYVR